VTNKQRRDRIQRLRNLRERARDEKRGALAKAQQRKEVAQLAHEEAETTWQERAAGIAAPTITNAADFAANRMHLADLKLQAEHHRLEREAAEQEESERRDETQVAQRELRKMELWGESENEKIRKEQARRDQILTDEMAAQISLREPRR